MRNATKMLMLSGEGRDGRGERRDYGRSELDMGGGYSAYTPYAGAGYMNYDMEDRYREYPRNDMNEVESRRRRDSRGRFRSEMDEMESRRRRDSRGRFRSESDWDLKDNTSMHYPMYPPPVYEEYGGMNQIGFAAHDGMERNNLHMIRGGAGHSEHLDKQTAEQWMESLHNEDGTKGPHWTMEQVKQVMSQKNWKEDPVRAWVVMNMMYSDYCAAAKKVNANTVDFYVNMAKAFLDDKDAGVEDKLAAYYYNIVK